MILRKTLFILTTLLFSSTITYAQAVKLQYKLSNEEMFCHSILELDTEHQKAYYMKRCGCVVGEMIMMVGVSSYIQNDKRITFRAVPVSQSLWVSTKDFVEGDENPSVVFLDVFQDTMKCDSVVVFKLGNNDQIIGGKGFKDMDDRKLNDFIFNLKKVGNKTHFTIPYLHRIFKDDIVFSIPAEDKNRMIVRLNFPSYSNPYFGIKNFSYTPIEGTFTMDTDSTLYNRRSKMGFTKKSVSAN